jgi:uncharacterized protein YjdB
MLKTNTFLLFIKFICDAVSDIVLLCSFIINCFDMTKVKFLTLMFVLALMIASCKDDVAVSSVSVEPTSVSLTVGEETTLTATVLPSDADDQTVIWSSDNTDVATVSSTVNSYGIVTAISEGTANITVTTSDGAKTATCAVTVSISSEEV